MINHQPGGQAYNRFTFLDGIEDRIIYYLLSEKGKTPCELEETYKIWRLLLYDDIEALSPERTPKFEDVAKLICTDNIDQEKFRIFRSCHLEDAWTIQSTFLKIYIDSILPENPYIAQVNIGVDIIVHNKIINVNIPEEEQLKIAPIYVDVLKDENGEPIKDEDGKIKTVEYRITQKSRVSILTKAILSLLNGADIQGVGKLLFSMDMNRFQQAQYEIWNNRNFEGMKIVLGTRFSGVS